MTQGDPPSGSGRGAAGADRRPPPRAPADPRFARIATDPRFARFPKAKARADVDDRFAGEATACLGVRVCSRT